MTVHTVGPAARETPITLARPGFGQIVYRHQDGDLLGHAGLGPIATSLTPDELPGWNDELRDHVAVDADDRGAPVTSVAFVHTGRGAAIVRREYVVNGNNARVLLDPGRDLGPHAALVLTEESVWANIPAVEDVAPGYELAPLPADLITDALDAHAERLRARAREQAYLLEVAVAAVLRHPGRFFSFRQVDVGIDPVPMLWGLSDLLLWLVPVSFTFSTFETRDDSGRPRFVVLPRRARDTEPWAGRYRLVVREEPKAGSDVHAHAAALLVSRYTDTDWPGIHHLMEGMRDLRRLGHDRAGERSREICERLGRRKATPPAPAAAPAPAARPARPVRVPVAEPAPVRVRRVVTVSADDEEPAFPSSPTDAFPEHVPAADAEDTVPVTRESEQSDPDRADDADDPVPAGLPWFPDPDATEFEENEDAFAEPWPGFEEERGELPIPALPIADDADDDPDTLPDPDAYEHDHGRESPPTPGTLPPSAGNAPWSMWAAYGIPDTEVDKIRRAVKRLPDKPTLRERALGGGAAKSAVAEIDNIVTLATALRLADVRVLGVIADRLTTRLEQRRRQLAPEAWNPEDLAAMRETLLDAEQFGDRLTAAGAGDKRTRKLFEQLLAVVLGPRGDTRGVLRQIAMCVMSERRDRSPNPLIEEILLDSVWGERFRTELGRRWSEQNPPR